MSDEVNSGGLSLATSTSHPPVDERRRIDFYPPVLATLQQLQAQLADCSLHERPQRPSPTHRLSLLHCSEQLTLSARQLQRHARSLHQHAAVQLRRFKPSPEPSTSAWGQLPSALLPHICSHLLSSVSMKDLYRLSLVIDQPTLLPLTG